MNADISKYAQDGVNVTEGDDFSKIAGAVCKNTFHNSPFVEVCDFSSGHFRGPRGFKIKGLPAGYMLDVAPDGIGTKVVAIDAALAHHYACRDVIAMTASDITRWGGKSLVFVNVLDVSTLSDRGTETNLLFRSMMAGLESVAHEQGIVCFRGETAELGACVGSENSEARTKFNWAGFMLGVYLPNRMITGDTLKEGQVVVALQENGFRSNGLSSVRVALQSRFGDEWWKNPDAASAIRDVACPSILYDNFLTLANGWNLSQSPYFKIHLLTHVSGGGIVGKFAEDMLFPRGFSAVLDNLYDPPEIMKDVAMWRGMTDEECYRTFNCGNGMLAVLDKKYVDAFVNLADSYGVHAKACGIITQEREPSLVIHSGFNNNVIEYS